MRKLAFASILLITVLLAACSNWKTLEYDVLLDAEDSARRTELLQALERVTERRLKQKNIGETAITVTSKKKQGLLTISGIQSKEQSVSITAMLGEPFDFTIRIKKENEEAGGREEEIAGNWEETGINGSHLNWIEVIQQQNSGAIGAELQFNEEAREKFATLFEENEGGTLGIFVRDLLISELSVKSSELKDRILITDIPSLAIAKVFADDVNVGIHTQLVKR